MQQSYNFLLQLVFGTAITIQLALAALAVGLVFGLLGAVGKLSTNIVLQKFSYLWTELIRGIPELLVLLLIYFGGTLLLTKLLGHYVAVNAFISGVFALGLIFASYASEVFRGAYLAIPYGQFEAAYALGLSNQQTFFTITLPQLWRHALPGLGNLWLVLLKDTALVSLIGLNDLMLRAKLASAYTHNPLLFFTAAAIIYLILTSISMYMHKYWYKKVSVYELA